MAAKWIIHTGIYAGVEAAGIKTATVISQSTQTDASMSEWGSSIAQNWNEGHYFNNIGCVFTGIRRSVVDGTCNPDDIEIRFYPNELPNYTVLKMNPYGVIDPCPQGFMDQDLIDMTYIVRTRVNSLKNQKLNAV